MRNAPALFAALSLLLTACIPSPPPGPITRWAAYYDQALPASTFENLDLVVFDRVHHTEFESLQPRTVVLAYISLGEVRADAPEHKILETAGALLYHNTHWDSHAVDLTSDIWREMVLGAVADAVAQGFDGVMLDTLDSPLHWAETQAPARLEHTKRAAVEIIRTLRARYPKLKIMVNRAFILLPQVSNDIDYILAESILVKTDVSAGQFEFFSPMDYSQVAVQLHQAMTQAPHLQVFTLDYWMVEDVKGLERIYAQQRAESFIPYVTSPSLREYTPEPEPIRRDTE